MKKTSRLLAILALAVGCGTSKYAERCTRLVTIPPESADREFEALLATAPLDSPCVIVEQHAGEPQFALWVEGSEGNRDKFRVVVRTQGADGQPRTYARDIDVGDYRMVVDTVCTTSFSRAESHLKTRCHLYRSVRYIVRRLEPPHGKGANLGFARMYPPTTSPLRELENVIQSLAAYVAAPDELALVRYLHFSRSLTELDRLLHRPECDAGVPVHHGNDGQLTCK